MTVKGELFETMDAAIARAGDALADARQPHLFDRASWLHLTQTHVLQDTRPLIACARDGNHAAWLFLKQTRNGAAEAFASWYTLGFRPVFSDVMPHAQRLALLTKIARDLKPRLGSLNLAPVPSDDGTSALLVEAFRAAGWAARVTPKTGHWHTPICGSFEDFWLSRPKKLRNTLERKRRKFAIETEVHTKCSAAAWQAYQEVYAQSWKGDEGSPAFLAALAHQQGEAGTLRLGIARFEGKPVATQLWTLDQSGAIIHKLAYREDAAHMSPGTILGTALFRHVIDEDHVAQISYGTGDDRYKSDWMDKREQLNLIEFWNPARISGLAGLAKSLTSRFINALKSPRQD